MTDKDIDDFTGIETTGHEWDGIKELNNPLPRWWLWTFYATIVFSIGYVIYYPAIPLFEASTMGISGQTNRSVLAQDLAKAETAKADILSRIVDTDLETIRTSDELSRFAVAGGASLYKVHCSQCHGSGAQGASGYPNLNDDDWLWGGDLQSIYTSIKHGIRNDHDDEARVSDMPAFGTDGILERGQILAVGEYVLSLSGQDHDAKQAAEGVAIYGENCAACHGDNGRGLREVGGPNLADALWLYGGSRADIIKQISAPQHGVMPAWGERLGEAGIRQLSVYIHSLGGGEAAKTE